MSEEENREMARSNYAAQMNSLGYDASGNPFPSVSDDGKRKIVFKKYRLTPYYGPPYEPEELDGDRTYNYMLNTPYPLSYEQMKAILQVIKEFGRNRRGYTDGVMLLDGSIDS